MKRAANYTDEQNEADALALSGFLNRLSKFPAPTVALVQGPAFGGGVGLITSAVDIAVGVQRAKFMLSEVRLGLLPATISPYVIRRIGACSAAVTFSPPRCLTQTARWRWDSCTRSQPMKTSSLSGRVNFGRQYWATRHLASPRAKELIDAVEGREIDEAVMKDTAKRLALQRKSPEGKEGLGAFLEKRKPSWAP